MTAPRRLKMETGTRDEDERDDSPGGGLLHRTRYLRGWDKHLHGYGCPRCGTTCRDRASRDLHDKWHRDDDDAWTEWSETVEALAERVTDLEAQHAFIAQLLGPSLAEMMAEREGAVAT